MNTSKEIKLILTELNALRANPASMAKKFEVVARALSRVKSKKKESEELAEFSKTLVDVEPMPILQLSPGLCMAAQAELDHIKSSGSDFHMKLTHEDLTEHVKEYVDYFNKINELLDHGDIDNILARFMISDHDPQRLYRKSIFNQYYQYVGIAYDEIKGEETTIIILSDIIKEKEYKARRELNWDDYDEIKQAFDLFDINNIGRIDPKETKKAMQHLGFNVKHPTIFQIIEKLDTPENQKTGGVKYEDFVYAIEDDLGEDKTKQGLYRIFSLFLDDPSSDRISLGALKKIASELEDRIKIKEINELIKIATANGNYLTFDEFYQVLAE